MKPLVFATRDASPPMRRKTQKEPSRPAQGWDGSFFVPNSHRHNPKKWRKQECIVIFFDKTSSSRPSLPEKIPCRKRWETGLLMTKNKAVPNKQPRWSGHLGCLMVRKRWDDRVKTVRWSGQNSLFSTIKKWLKIKVTDIQQVRKQPEIREKSGKWPSVFNFRLLRARFLSVY